MPPPRELVAAARQPGGRLRGRAVVAVCCAVAVAAGLLALARQPPPGEGSSAELEGRQLAEEQNSPVLRIGHGFRFYDVSGFDEGSLQRRVRLDAADQDANAALQWANAQRLRRDAAPAQPVEAPVQSRTERKPRRHIIPHRSWITPFRASQASSNFRAVAPPGFKRTYGGAAGADHVDTTGGGVHSSTGTPGGDAGTGPPGGERDTTRGGQPAPGHSTTGLPGGAPDSQHPQGARTEPSPATIRNRWADGARSLARAVPVGP